MTTDGGLPWPASRATARRPGQHFLRSLRVVRSLVDEAGIGPGELVVDIGAGAGPSPPSSSRAGAEVWAVEADPLLAAVPAERFDGTRRVVEADARG